uniref:conserved oligomeric Golgi complex subunit 2 isoform X1 n=1 Tax=Bombus vancouverensis nearcticus TaxID=2705178 RepID=UPI00143AC467|nr:conserved oligomeric Golgi complex subunit 2 isoform X1 [Bombus vancouverensis nearcticus]XP_033189718.1 conserved oligomeric Golgi complex subunit 2 isoform X1 [Bombus vancouverensis nearcticus]XP_033189719.1 conserved oligomeric Golgi complex subunit 2 isoform X1 [Bombus vancouverensis nearcticus]
MSKENINLPKAPNDLCFSEVDFIQENFNVDTFLQEHRKSTKLETMRDDLGIYLKLLRSAMIDLINRDYTDFVNLSSNMIGLDKAISDLQTPLGQLREEVMQVQQILNDEVTAITHNMNENKKTREYKRSVFSLQHIYKSLNKLSTILSLNTFLECPAKIDILEQAAAEFNQLGFHMSRCKLNIINENQKEAEELEQSYMTYLNEFFLASIQEKNSFLLIRCLGIYVTLDKISDAEDLVRKEIVGPLIHNVINTENLKTDLLGLQNIYNRLLNILNVELKQLLDITLYPNRLSVKGFNFLVNSFWIDVEEKIEQYIKYIFAPGDPILFHSRYVATLEFLEKLEAECITPESLITLQKNLQYKNFLKKWNLPVYFQIKFQEIASGIETVLTESISPASVKGTLESLTQDDFSLYATCIIWENLQTIWDNNVYLHQLFHRFWKFSLQICARYRIWIQTVLKEVWPIENEISNLNKVEHSTKLNFLICLYKDVEKFVNILPFLFEIARSKFKQENPRILTLLKDSLDETIKNLKTIWPQITKEIVDELLKQCVTHLKQVSDIPRLFRRTKRDVPTKPCSYVKNTLVFLLNFHADYKKIIPDNVNYWLELALSELTEHYLASVTDVLTSVQKTEESLRRLKKIRDKSTGSLTSEVQGISDDEKIRIQLQVDVQAYANMITEMQISISNVLYMKELLHAVETAIKR